jgi:hypothetical protein
MKNLELHWIVLSDSHDRPVQSFKKRGSVRDQQSESNIDSIKIM